MDLVKWQKMSLAEQLGNIASEVSRAAGWEIKNDLTAKDNSLRRALELIDSAIENKKSPSSFKELSRLREVISDQLGQTNFYQVSLTQLQDYLLPFAVLARK